MLSLNYTIWFPIDGCLPSAELMMISSMKIAGYAPCSHDDQPGLTIIRGPGATQQGNYREQNLNRGQFDKGESLISTNYG